jgi:hypothetical protein
MAMAEMAAIGTPSVTPEAPDAPDPLAPTSPVHSTTRRRGLLLDACSGHGCAVAALLGDG